MIGESELREMIKRDFISVGRRKKLPNYLDEREREEILNDIDKKSISEIRAELLEHFSGWRYHLQYFTEDIPTVETASSPVIKRLAEEHKNKYFRIARELVYDTIKKWADEHVKMSKSKPITIITEEGKRVKPSESEVLVIGAGLKWIHDLPSHPPKLTLVDNNDLIVQLSKRFQKEFGLSKTNILKGDMTQRFIDYKLRGKKFDKIILESVTHHLTDQIEEKLSKDAVPFFEIGLARRFMKLLKPGGEIHITNVGIPFEARLVPKELLKEFKRNRFQVESKKELVGFHPVKFKEELRYRWIIRKPRE